MKGEGVNLFGDIVDAKMARLLELLIKAVAAKKERMFDCEPFSTGTDREYLHGEIASADRMIAMFKAMRLTRSTSAAHIVPRRFLAGSSATIVAIARPGDGVAAPILHAVGGSSVEQDAARIRAT
jgi:hypothetical protein